MALEEKKLFVGGLCPETTEDDLRAHFGEYGTIDFCNIKMDRETQRSKCYGFITFTEDSAVDDAIAAGEHKIKGKVSDPKRATKQQRWEPPKPKKVFVGGVPNDVKEEELKKEFSQFGAVQEVVFPVVIETQKRRGFAFVEFASEDSVDKACRSGTPIFVGSEQKQVEVKPATPRGDRGGGRGGRREYVRQCIVPSTAA